MSTAEGETATEMVDWQLATGVARRLLRPGPAVSRAQADQVVAELRQFAAESEGHVREFTGLQATSATAPVVIVDRPGWVQANADGFRTVLQPLADKLREKADRTAGLSSAVGSRVTGIEAGALLAFLSSRVLGQFDPFYPAQPDPDRPGLTGRLLLVAPNVMHVESELDVVPRDFRLWVCLHEETHRVQFTAVPWLRDHLRSEIALFLDQAELDASAYAAMFREAAQRLGRSIRGEAELSLVDLMQSPEQRAVLDRLTAVMSLLEGHADFVMDGVGPAVIPTVDKIRSKFSSRRTSGNPVDQLLKRLLGLDAKLRQYKDGAAFVRHVVDRVGMEGFNRVWTGPNTLPTKNEIANPDAWVTRLHG
ncbi:zinc-dependent metalloprotease [Kribbella solani]|uniref:zinc-dependent metalloprotease n=1 Tax=Kribbella solani TaxID=236067 RepID=UPI0029B17D75|nr:zinc-dependent metalloprotease [Kribbella solani]MDX2967718.1 zinc-dependent metalloprotease [Kribbella solani]MDX3001124.1 zinc-dependent metalloprotease [Kribbella solani]